MVDLLQKGIHGKLAWDIKLFPELSAAVQAHAGQIEGPGHFRLIQTGIFQIPARGDKVFLIVLFTFLCVSCPCANAGADFFLIHVHAPSAVRLSAKELQPPEVI